VNKSGFFRRAKVEIAPNTPGQTDIASRIAARPSRWIWASVVIDAIRSEDGTLIGFAKVTRDVTEKRQAQEALERTQQALFQAQKMEALGQLTGGIAHDFNNLLVAVLGASRSPRSERSPAKTTRASSKTPSRGQGGVPH
jgi:C4-dicarboxylate-specific signal transduction histidine kinase